MNATIDREIKTELDRIDADIREVSRNQSNKVYRVVGSTVMTVNIALLAWTGNTLINQGRQIERVETRTDSNTTRITKIEDGGSSGLQSHVREDDSRVADIKARQDRMETTLAILSATPGELKSLSVRLDSVADSVQRIEKKLDERRQ